MNDNPLSKRWKKLESVFQLFGISGVSTYSGVACKINQELIIDEIL